MSADDVKQMLMRATSLIREGQIASARSILEWALRSNDPNVAFALAETYDPKTLARWRAIGIVANPDRARALYKQALSGGVAEAGTLCTRTVNVNVVVFARIVILWTGTRRPAFTGTKTAAPFRWSARHCPC